MASSADNSLKTQVILHGLPQDLPVYVGGWYMVLYKT